MLSLPNYSGPVMAGATPDPLQRNRERGGAGADRGAASAGPRSMGSDAVVPKIGSPATATELRRRRPRGPRRIAAGTRSGLPSSGPNRSGGASVTAR
jgi:hypothetical protein